MDRGSGLGLRRGGGGRSWRASVRPFFNASDELRADPEHEIPVPDHDEVVGLGLNLADDLTEQQQKLFTEIDVLERLLGQFIIAYEKLKEFRQHPGAWTA